MRRRRSNLGLLRTERLLPGNPRRLIAQPRQRVEETGARLEVDRGRHRDRHLLFRMVVERGTPQVASTHRSCDKCRQPDRIRRQHGQQFAGHTGRRLGGILARELDTILAALFCAVQSAVRGP
jgi:hypothetical protein